MTKFQSYIAGIGIFASGVALTVVGALVKNDTLLGLGGGLLMSGLAALGIPRPQDAPY